MSQLDILTLGLKETWNIFKSEIDMESEEYRAVRFGQHIEFDINDHVNGNIITKGKSRKAIIYGLSYDLSDLYTELEIRERIMKEWLKENLKDEELTTARGIE